MRKLFAFTVCGILAVVVFPLILILSVLSIFMDILFIVSESINPDVGYYHNLGYELWQHYFTFIKDSYSKMMEEHDNDNNKTGDSI